MCLQFPENLVNVTWTICCSISTRPLYCLCPRGNMARKIYFSTAVVFCLWKKKKTSKRKKCCRAPSPLAPPPLPRCFLMVDLSKPSVAFTEGLMVSAKPANPWRERSLRANEEQLVSPCLWQLECLSVCLCACAVVAADLCTGSEMSSLVWKWSLSLKFCPICCAAAITVKC